VRLFIFFILLINTPFVKKPVLEFTPERIQKCAVIKVEYPIDKVFPLFGPVREMEWAFGWHPEIIYSSTNLVEEHMIFRTKARHAEEDYYLWVITKYEPSKYNIEYMVSTPNRVWFIHVDCESEGLFTQVKICYAYTGLNETGNRLNRESLQNMFADNLIDWQQAINHYLKHGKILTH
jgi:hypothetical protein